MTALPPRPEFTEPGLWPTPPQLLVLQAALLPAAAARAAFEEWVGTIDLDKDFDQGTFRILPLMYMNLRQIGVEHPLMSRLKGIYRLAWYKNNKLFSDTTAMIEALHAASIPIMLLKGVPLVRQYYGNIALRPMADIDILIPTAMATRVVEVMQRFPYMRYTAPTEDFLKFRPAMAYWSDTEGQLDVHWHALRDCLAPAADETYWQTARPIDFNGIPCLMPDPTRMLFHVVIHGLRWNPEPPIRWIADAMTILRVAGDEIDWRAIVRDARAFRLSHRLHLSFAYLQRHFSAPIPEDVVRELARHGVSMVERIESAYVLHDPTRLYESPLGHFWIGFGDYCRWAQNQTPWAFVIEFTHYLRFHWQLRGRSEILGYLVRGVTKRVQRSLQPGAHGSAAAAKSAPGLPNDL